MKNIKIKENIIPNIGQLMNLYQDVGWTGYTNKPDVLEKAINNCLKVWTAWDGNQLVGLARVVGDGYTIIYIQDILVLESYQRQGIGSQLLKTILDEYESIHQIVLITGNEEKTVDYYEKNGLVNIADYDGVAFTK